MRGILVTEGPVYIESHTSLALIWTDYYPVVLITYETQSYTWGELSKQYSKTP